VEEEASMVVVLVADTSEEEEASVGVVSEAVAGASVEVALVRRT
jgi:hypothetical protein